MPDEPLNHFLKTELPSVLWPSSLTVIKWCLEEESITARHENLLGVLILMGSNICILSRYKIWQKGCILIAAATDLEVDQRGAMGAGVTKTCLSICINEIKAQKILI